MKGPSKVKMPPSNTRGRSPLMVVALTAMIVSPTCRIPSAGEPLVSSLTVKSWVEPLGTKRASIPVAPMLNGPYSFPCLTMISTFCAGELVPNNPIKMGSSCQPQTSRHSAPDGRLPPQKDTRSAAQEKRVDVTVLIFFTTQVLHHACRHPG